MNKRVLSWGLKILGIALAVFLLVWTVRRTDADPLHEIMHSNRPMLFLAFLCVGMTHVLASYRWGRYWRCRAYGFRIGRCCS
jgi:uncharacterized membrane protein YbhN (UPF0104 family)